MREYTITRISGAPNWSSIPAAAIDNLLWTKEINASAQVQLCCDESALIIRFTSTEDDIRAVNTGLLDQPCEDSCLEFFFSPVAGDKRYFNIEMNPNACMYLGMGTDRYDLVRLMPSKNPFAPQITREDPTWTLTYRIPYSFIRQFFPAFTDAPGTVIRGNFYKCAELTKIEHYMSWNLIPLTKPEFHCSEYFGLLRFA